MATEQIYLAEDKTGRCVIVHPGDDDHEHRAKQGENMHWVVHNGCSGSRFVELRRLRGVVEPPLSATVPSGQTRRIGGRAIGAPDRRYKYDIYVDGSRERDPYLVIDRVVVVLLTALGGIAAGYLAYRAIRSWIGKNYVIAELPAGDETPRQSD